jgi:hypothetical protein
MARSIEERILDQGVDLSACPKCGGDLRVIGEVTDPRRFSQYAGSTAIRPFVLTILSRNPEIHFGGA